MVEGMAAVRKRRNQAEKRGCWEEARGRGVRGEVGGRIGGWGPGEEMGEGGEEGRLTACRICSLCSSVISGSTNPDFCLRASHNLQ